MKKMATWKKGNDSYQDDQGYDGDRATFGIHKVTQKTKCDHHNVKRKTFETHGNAIEIYTTKEDRDFILWCLKPMNRSRLEIERDQT